jgi:hypothetical protein
VAPSKTSHEINATVSDIKDAFVIIKHGEKQNLHNGGLHRWVYDKNHLPDPMFGVPSKS